MLYLVFSYFLVLFSIAKVNANIISKIDIYLYWLEWECNSYWNMAENCYGAVIVGTARTERQIEVRIVQVMILVDAEIFI